MATRAKVLEFEVSIEDDGGVAAEACPPLKLPREWTAEHLLLTALLRCSLTSLRHHVRRVGAELSGDGTARGTITKRESDDRYAFVSIDAELTVEIEPEPSSDEVAELLAKAERDCFIGASLSTKTSYRWTVNGRAAPSSDRAP
jgi:organic hydroperoxide reductase OsmC/OhrA